MNPMYQNKGLGLIKQRKNRVWVGAGEVNFQRSIIQRISLPPPPLFKAAPEVYGNLQAGNQIRALSHSCDLCHSCGKALGHCLGLNLNPRRDLSHCSWSLNPWRHSGNARVSLLKPGRLKPWEPISMGCPA